MAKEGRKGFVLYHSDVDILRKQLSPAEFMGVVTAISDYSRDGQEPPEGALSPLAAMAFAMIRPKIDHADDAYKKTCERRREAACKRWEAEKGDANASNSMQVHANACKCNNSMQKMLNEIESETEIEVEDEMKSKKGRAPAPADHFGGIVNPPAGLGDALTPEEIAGAQHDGKIAEELLRKYRLPGPAYDPLLDRLREWGETELRRVLDEAAVSNNRSGLSIRYLDAIHKGAGRKPAAAPAPGQVARPCKTVSKHNYEQRHYDPADDDKYFFDIMNGDPF